MNLYSKIIKPIFFKMDPEFVHDRITNTGKILGKFNLTKKIVNKLFNYENDPYLHQKILDIDFYNPVGLSAGFDKNADLVNILPEVGFSYMEVGSVTLNPYAGNPKPRLYRLPKSKGLVVYYGLKNIGVHKIIDKIKNYTHDRFVMGISIAKTNCKDTSTTEGGINDYFGAMRELENKNIGKFYTINISCPNTFGGEPFTTPDKLDALLQKIAELKIKKPVFVKMPINLDWQEFRQLLDVIVKYEISGVVIGNLTKDKTSNLIKDEIPENIKGGISGKPTWELSNNLIKQTFKNYKDKLIIIGVGGIFDAKDAYQKIKYGASLLQMITGMIYEGPQTIGKINKGLVELLKQEGYNNISEAIGADVK
jgi:dihydroorotate dehydrogenase